MSQETRIGWIDKSGELPVERQCELAEVSRATTYRRQNKSANEVHGDELEICRLIDEEYTLHPFYGSRRMKVFLSSQGYRINRKRIQRLMRKMGLAGMAPGPATSVKHPAHKVYPYLLRGVPITRPNQVWSTDVTYIRLARGFVYLVAVIDWYSRKVLSWRISNSMDASFCVDCLEDALRDYGKPSIFNTDQGTQFTSNAFTDVLKREGITISMDGRGRALDNIFVERLWRNVKHEDVYLKGYANMAELTVGLAQYFAFYNEKRPHQSLSYQTPSQVYMSAKGGGALIVDKYRSKDDDTALPGAATGEKTSPAAKKEQDGAALISCDNEKWI
jgi:putative transposase